MRNRKEPTFNVRSFNIDQLPIKRILLLSLLAYLVIVIEFFLLTSYRMLYLPDAAATLCGGAGATYTICVSELIKIMLNGGQWSAVSFSIYVFTLIPIMYLIMCKQKSSILGSMLVLTLILSIVIITSLEPASVAVSSIIISSTLTGLFIHKRRGNEKSK